MNRDLRPLYRPRNLRQRYGGIFFVDGEDRHFAVVKGRKTGKWSFPKGRAEPGETPWEAAHREIEEEIGLKDLPCPLTLRTAGSTQFYVYELKECVPLHTHDPQEVEECRWMTEEELFLQSVNRGVLDYFGWYRKREKE